MIIASTTYQDVVNVFEATFQEKYQLDSSLVLQWFNMAIEEFSREIEPLVFDTTIDSFLYYDNHNNLIQEIHLGFLTDIPVIFSCRNLPCLYIVSSLT